VRESSQFCRGAAVYMREGRWVRERLRPVCMLPPSFQLALTLLFSSSSSQPSPCSHHPVFAGVGVTPLVPFCCVGALLCEGCARVQRLRDCARAPSYDARAPPIFCGLRPHNAPVATPVATIVVNLCLCAAGGRRSDAELSAKDAAPRGFFQSSAQCPARHPARARPAVGTPTHNPWGATACAHRSLWTVRGPNLFALPALTPLSPHFPHSLSPLPSQEPAPSPAPHRRAQHTPSLLPPFFQRRRLVHLIFSPSPP
jgi:hypothetical protein